AFNRRRGRDATPRPIAPRPCRPWREASGATARPPPRPWALGRAPRQPGTARRAASSARRPLTSPSTPPRPHSRGRSVRARSPGQLALRGLAPLRDGAVPLGLDLQPRAEPLHAGPDHPVARLDPLLDLAIAVAKHADFADVAHRGDILGFALLVLLRL